MVLMLAIAFFIYFINNVKPKKIEFNFNKCVEEESFINRYAIEKNKQKITLYFETNSEIFEGYNYHSYVSGDGYGKKIKLETYLISEDKSICYKLKTNCYDYTDIDNIKFVCCYYNSFIKLDQKYKIAIYVEDKDILYLTNIEI